MATHESTIMDILKEKSNVMNQAYQEFQSSLRALINQLIESETTDQKSVCETNIQRLLCDYSFKMNRLEASYLERCESIINNLPTTLTATNTVSKLIKTSSFTRTRIIDSHPIKFSHSQSESRNYGNECHRKRHNTSTHSFGDTKQTSRARYQCEVCSKSMGSAQALKEHHIQMHTTETPFHCDHDGCDKAFKIKRFLHHHVRTDHDGYPYPCPDPQCDEAFKYKQEMDAHYKLKHEHESSLKRHNRQNHSVPGQLENDEIDYHPSKRRRISTGSVSQSGINGSQPRHQCNICFKVFSSSNALGGHKSGAHRDLNVVTKSTTTPMVAVVCRHCGKAFSQKCDLYKHIRGFHDLPPFHCDVNGCNASFDWARNLRAHHKSVHSAHHSKDEADYMQSGSALGGHKSAAHRNEKGVTNQEEYRCDRCFRSFTTMHGLSGHRGHCPMNPSNRHNTMGNDAVFKCDHCGCHFNRKADLYSHLRDQHDIAPFVCNIDGCSSTFRYYRQWQKHQKAEHFQKFSDDAGELEMFECSICGKVLSNAKQLRNHELLHSAERPYQCHLCDSAFVVKSRLRNHLLYVHKVKPYPCEHCDAGFTKQMDLVSHQTQCPGYVRSETEKNGQGEGASNEVNIGRIHSMEQDAANTGNVGRDSERSILNQRL